MLKTLTRSTPIVLLLLLIVEMLLAADTAKKYRVSFNNYPVKQALDSLSRLSGRPFFFNAHDFPADWKVTLTIYGTVPEILDAMFYKRPFRFEESGNDVFISRKAKQFSLEVVNKRREALAGVTLYDPDSKQEWTTDAEGRWQATLYAETVHLQLSSVAYRDTAFLLDQPTLIVLSENHQEENEVIVAYGKTSYKRANGAITRVVPGTIINPYSITDVFATVPGLLVNTKSDIRWGNNSVELRGSRTIQPLSPGRRIDAPLIIIENIPCLPCTGPQSQVISVLGNPLGDGPGLHQLTFLNVDDIESITVLKDALATAIYGARAAHGVILITLRKPTTKELRVHVNITTGVLLASRIPGALGTRDYLGLRYESLDSGAVLNKQYTPDLFLDSARYTNWPKELYKRAALTHTAQVSVSGGRRAFYWLGSLNYRQEQYVFPTTVKDEWARFYAQLRYQPSGQSFSISAFTTASLGRNAGPGSDLTPIVYAMPHAAGYVREDSLAAFDDPLRLLNSRYLAESRYYLSNIQVNIPLWRNVKAVVTAGTGWQELLEKAAYPESSLPRNNGQGGQLDQAGRQVRTWITEPQLHWQVQPGQLEIVGVLGASYQQSRYRSSREHRDHFTDDAELYKQLLFPQVDTSWTPYKLLSGFSRVNIAWKKQFQLEATARLDASSRFHRAQRTKLFTAAGGSWIASEAPFLRRLRHELSFAKIRFSHGLTGSDQVADYAYMGQWAPSNNAYPYGAYPGLQVEMPLNARLTWATTRKTEAGILLEWRRRLQAEAGYYFHRSLNQVVTAPLSAQSGFATLPYWNYRAVVDNRGWDFSLRYKTSDSSRWKFTIAFNYTLPRNRLQALPRQASPSLGDSLLVGHPLSAVHVYQALGINNQGLYQMADLDGDNAITPADKREIRDVEVRGYGALQVTIERHQWQFNILAEARRGTGYTASYYNNLRLYPGTLRPDGYSNQPVGVLDRWPRSAQAVYQRPASSLTPAEQEALDRQQASTASYTDQSYVCLRALNLQYTVAADRLPWRCIEKLRFFAQAQNLFVWSPYRDGNPLLQSPFSQPISRLFSLGMQVGFKP